ncbi:response regulator [Nitrosarchaeum koreense]|nr:response regulator [Nitrosarchaeum koreense]
MKILLIDDNEEVRDTLSSILEIFDYEMTTCIGGREGLEILSNQDFDCILLDLTMPKFSGFDFLEEFGYEKNSSNTIFTLSAMNLSDEQHEYLTKMGVKKIISKPIGTDELMEILQKVELKEVPHVGVS